MNGRSLNRFIDTAAKWGMIEWRTRNQYRFVSICSNIETAMFDSNFNIVSEEKKRFVTTKIIGDERVM